MPSDTSSVTRRPGRVQQLDERAVPQASRRGDVGQRQQPIDLLDRKVLRQRRPRPRRLQIFGRVVVARDDGRRGSDRTRELTTPRAPPNAATGRAPSARARRPRAPGGPVASSARRAAGGKPSQVLEVARVAVDGIRRSPPLDAQVIEPGVHQRRRRQRCVGRIGLARLHDPMAPRAISRACVRGPTQTPPAARRRRRAPRSCCRSEWPRRRAAPPCSSRRNSGST